MSENIKKLSLVIPILFILHNLEEVIGFNYMKAIIVPFSNILTYNKKEFVFAVMFLSIVVVLLFAFNYRFNNKILNNIVIFISLILALNGLSHVFISIYIKKVQPGLITGVIIVVFYIYFIKNYRKEASFNLKNILFLILLGIPFMIFSILVSLVLGKLLAGLL